MDGGGWTTEIFLVNPSEASIAGKLQFFSQGSETQSAQPVSMNVDGTTNTLFGYSVAARSARRLRTSGEDRNTRAGSVFVTPDTGNASPTAMVVFSMKQNGVTKTEAGVLSAKPTTAVRMYVEAAGKLGDPGSMQSGFAVSNPSPDQISVLFELTTASGQATDVSKSFDIPGRGQIAMFLSEIAGFESQTLPFEGVLRISTTSTAGIVVTGLRCRYNERSEFLITTTAAADENAVVSTAETLFPQIVDSGGYKTQFVWFSNVPGQAHTVCVRYLSKAGAPLNLNIR